jgi:hypothetical protein
MADSSFMKKAVRRIGTAVMPILAATALLSSASSVHAQAAYYYSPSNSSDAQYNPYGSGYPYGYNPGGPNQQYPGYPYGGSGGYPYYPGYPYQQSPPLSVYCSAQSAPTTGNGVFVTWYAYASGGDGSYSYNWSGPGISNLNSNRVSADYTWSGTEYASVTVASGGQSVTQSCGGIQVNVQQQQYYQYPQYQQYRYPYSSYPYRSYYQYPYEW